MYIYIYIILQSINHSIDVCMNHLPSLRRRSLQSWTQSAIRRRQPTRRRAMREQRRGLHGTKGVVSPSNLRVNHLAPLVLFSLPGRGSRDAHRTG